MEFSSDTEQTARRKSPIGDFRLSGANAKMRPMKRLVIIIVVIVAVALAYAVSGHFSTSKTATPAKTENGAFRPDPSNATFIFEDGSVTLSSGQNEKPITPDGVLVEETVLLDKFAYGDINADDKEDTVLLLARYGGGSGTFVYLAAFVSGPVTYRGSEAIFIGDRIIPQSISISGNVVTVVYLDRRAGEALADESTVLVSRQFMYRAGKFEER